MGELVAGTPALRLTTAVSLPLDLVSVLSLLHRAMPESGLDPWLIETRRALPDDLRADLDLLHGFTGRRLYYVEEPVMQFEPLRADRVDATADELFQFLDDLTPAAYQELAIHALARVHRDLALDFTAPARDDAAAWRRVLTPALTSASRDAALELVMVPERLKARTISLYRGIWEFGYQQEYAAHLDELRAAARQARGATDRGFGLAFANLTGNRPPSALAPRLREVERVVFCPSAHLRSFVSYIAYPPHLVVFFGAPELLDRAQRAEDASLLDLSPSSSGAVSTLPAIGQSTAPNTGGAATNGITSEQMLEGFRALADPTRLRVLDLLGGGEQYAQEIVGLLGISQSAVSRHLSQLERAGLVTVQPRGGMKYYALDGRRLEGLARALRERGRPDLREAEPPQSETDSEPMAAAS